MRVVVLHGPEAFLRTELTTKLRELLVDATGTEVDTIRFDGRSARLADVLDECRSFGLMQQHKLVVVDDADQILKEDGRVIMQRYVESPAQDATLVLRSARWHPGNLDKEIAKVGVVFRCEVTSEDEAIAVAGRWAKQRHNSAIDPTAARMLVERLGADLGRIDTELAKLAAAAEASGEGTISASLVQSMVGKTREEEVWAIQSELISADSARALSFLGALFEQDPRNAAIPASYAMVDLARSISAASRAIAAGEAPGTVSKKLKLWPPEKQRKVLGAAERVEPAAAAGLLRDALETDAGLKSGGGNQRRLLEVMAVKVTSVLAR